MNEAITVEITRNLLKTLGYWDKTEEQQSKNPRIRKLLEHASKRGSGGGRPEFIIEIDNDNIVVIECKADVAKHKSLSGDRYADYAVDGVINYMAYLKKEYNVIGIAVSGQSEQELKITNCYQRKDDIDWSIIHTLNQHELNKIVPFSEYQKYISYDPKIEKARQTDLKEFARKVHDYMWKYAKLSETEKPLLISGILSALQGQDEHGNPVDSIFKKHYTDYRQTPRNANERAELAAELFNAIEKSFKTADIPVEKTKLMLEPYSFIQFHPNLSKKGADGNTPLRNIIDNICKDVDLLSHHSRNSYDIIGQFYGSFLKYVGGDKKHLGIVLTPPHICDLFTDLVNLTPQTKVIDPCAGTGSFLVSAMAKMLNKAKDDEKGHIKKEGLFGIEMQPNMYALATSNMFLRGDGKSNLHYGSCFDPKITGELKEKNIDIALFNPPYSQGSDPNLHELNFINNALDILRPEGTLVAIVPMSCAIKPSKHKEELLKNHTLKAVMSMPNELFYPVGVVSCIMVFEAHIPHAESGKKTWFGYWKDDGFTKTKKDGRIDLHNKWDNIKKQWLEMYHEGDVVLGMSAKAYVNADDEWCCEAYMETDYSDISDQDFENVLKNYSVFQLLNGEKK